MGEGFPRVVGVTVRRSSAKATRNLIVPITELEIGQSARVAYVNCRNDGQMHKLNGLQIRPGSTIKLHQRSPCSVVECEGAHIAMDDEIVENICVWANNGQATPVADELVELDQSPGKWWQRSLFSRR